MGAGLSPATPDAGGASAAALALAGNHKSVVRLLQKNCPGVPMGIPKRTNSRRSSDFGALLSSPDFGKGLDYAEKRRKGRERRSGGVSVSGDSGGRGKGGGGGKRAGPKGADEAGRRLLEAARVGDTMAIGRVLARGEIDVEWVGRSNGWTALMEAAEHGSLEAVCCLLDTGWVVGWIAIYVCVRRRVLFRDLYPRALSGVVVERLGRASPGCCVRFGGRHLSSRLVSFVVFRRLYCCTQRVYPPAAPVKRNGRVGPDKKSRGADHRSL